MKARLSHVLTILAALALALTSFPRQSAAQAQRGNSDPLYQQLRDLGLSGEVASVENWELQKDAATFRFTSGKFYFLSPVQNHLTGAVFIGEGQMLLTPKLSSEKRLMNILTHESGITESFEEAIFRFTDNTAGLIQKESPSHQDTADGRAKSALEDMNNDLRRKLRWNFAARLFVDITAEKPTGVFAAFVKGKKYSGKWLYIVDPFSDNITNPEEVSLRCYDDTSGGIWYSGHRSAEYLNGTASSKEWNQPVDIVHQDLETTLAKGTKLQGVSKTTFMPTRDGLRVLPFALYPSLRVSSVKDQDGHDIGFIQEKKDEDADFFVIFPAPLKKGQSYTFTTTYEGSEIIIDAGSGNYFLIGRESWYPNSSFGDYATYHMVFRLPKSLSIVATGTKVKEAVEGNSLVSEWASEVPLAVAGFNYGLFKVEEAKENSTNYEVESYANRDIPDDYKRIQRLVEQAEEEAGGMTQTTLGSISTVALAKKALAEAQLSVALYSNYFGLLPYGRIAMSQQPAPNFGQSWPMLVYMPIASYFDTTIRTQLYGVQLGTDPFWKIVGPHEVAHQWWGHILGWASYRDQWMSEGFSDFSASLFTQYVQKNTREFNKYWSDERRLITEKNERGVRPIEVGPVTMGYRLNTAKTGNVTRAMIYPKGAFILHMVRMMMRDVKKGDEQFIAMMKDFVKTNFNKTVSTEDFKAAVERHMTKDMDLDNNGKMDWFFNEYVYGTELPHYKLNYELGSEGGRTVASFTLTQSEVSPAFGMRVPIYAEWSDGGIARLGVLSIYGSSTSEQIKVPLAKKPKRLLLDAYEDVLCVID